MCAGMDDCGLFARIRATNNDKVKPLYMFNMLKMHELNRI